MRCEHEHDDAAYVLGALPPAEREAYERHLETCATCRASVAEVAGMPGLLARLDPASARETLTGPPSNRPRPGPAAPGLPTPPPPAPETLLPRILRAAAAEQRRNQRRARWRVAAGAAVAACLALVIGAGSVLALRDDTQPTPPPATPPMVAMVPVSQPSQVGANLTLVDHPWGTEIRMWCRYKGSTASPKHGYPKRYHYQLVAITREGTTTLLASWAAEAGGKEPEVTATTEYSRDQLESLELRRADGTPLLRYVL